MSTSSPDNVPGAAHPWWVRVCRVGWKVIRFFWVTFVFTFVLPNTVAVLFSDKSLQSLPYLWPILEGIVSHPIWTILIFLGLLLLTGLFWFGSRERNATTQRALSEQNRLHLLQRLRSTYDELMTRSLQDVAWLELGLASKPDAVQNVSTLLLRTPNQPERLLPAGISIVEVYEQANHELLILGEPGAGKSMLLLHLAQHLIEQAMQDVARPFPILLPLSSWAVKRLPLQEWLSEQFSLMYKVPWRFSQQWVKEEQVVLLLDGLDEMEESTCTACIAAINVYHHDHLQPLVICSRAEEYSHAAASERLALQHAVVVQALTPVQVNDYLVQAGRPLTALRTALRKNSTLAELATTPLMLHILVLIYHGTSVKQLPQSEVLLLQQIWNDYVQHMVERKGDIEHYPLHQTNIWLGWLARQMRRHSQTIFYLEQLQPDWLSKAHRLSYRLVVGLVYSLFLGLTFGLVAGLVVGLVAGLVGGLLSGFLIDWLIACLILGLSLGLMQGLTTAALVDTARKPGGRKNITSSSCVSPLRWSCTCLHEDRKSVHLMYGDTGRLVVRRPVILSAQQS